MDFLSTFVNHFRGLPQDFAMLTSLDFTSLSSIHFYLLLAAIVAALAFEFVNGFHDTANAVATVIYTKSMRPWVAVTWSGFWNFLGVLIGGTVVAMAIVKLLPADILLHQDTSRSLAMVFAILFAAIIWNLGTWYFGLPSSSSHTLIGSILGVGLANAFVHGQPLASGMNWSKVQDIGLALLISPIIGFSLAALMQTLFRKFVKSPRFHEAPVGDQRPPWTIRALLIATCTGVSAAHGSNDGQKGVGLVMLILISVLPGQFALKPDATPSQISGSIGAVGDFKKSLDEATVVAENAYVTGGKISILISEAHAAESASKTGTSAKEFEYTEKLREDLRKIQTSFDSGQSISSLSAAEKFTLRARIQSVDSSMSKLEKMNARVTATPQWLQMNSARKKLVSLIEYAPTWVCFLIALALGLGTMIGWKRIVLTIGEKIGKGHMTYSQGASAELIAMSTIGISAIAGLPVSTTHVLSSGVAGTMVANRSGVQSATVKKILMAWVFTLPVSIALSFGLYWAFVTFLI